jgi:dolichol-phosphate mannosyltransferase
MISLVIPLYNEGAIVEKLLDTSKAALLSISENFEIICVDDGSSDDTLEKLKDYHTQDNRVKIVVLSRNFGHQAAYTAGLNNAGGDYIAMMDGDLQDPPELIKAMYEKMIDEGYDIVHGKRTERHEGFIKKLLIKVFHIAFKNFSKIGQINNVGNFSCMNRQALNTFLRLREKNRYLPALRFFIGYKQGFIEYSRPDRTDGKAKMSFINLLNLAFDAIFSFSSLPLKVCLYLGLIGIVIFFTAGVYTVVSKLLGTALIGWSSILLSIYFLGSVQLLFLGIIGEYVFRIYKEIQDRPLFIVKEFIK